MPNLDQLVALYIGGLGNISPLSRTPNLEELHILFGHLEIETIPIGLSRLRAIHFKCCRINALTHLTHFPNLEELYFYHNYYTLNLASIPNNLINLKKLVLKGTDIINFSKLDRFTALEEMDLSENPRIDLATLPTDLQRLHTLRLKNCDLRDVSSLDRLSGLRSLVECSLSCNENIKIESIPGNLLHLRILRLRECNLCDFTEFNNFPGLVELDLTDNENLDYNTISPKIHSIINVDCWRRRKSKILNLQKRHY